MKNAFLILAMAVWLLATACGSYRNTNSNNDSLTTDSTVADTVTLRTDTTR